MTFQKKKNNVWSRLGRYSIEALFFPGCPKSDFLASIASSFLMTFLITHINYLSRLEAAHEGLPEQRAHHVALEVGAGIAAASVLWSATRMAAKRAQCSQ